MSGDEPKRWMDPDPYPSGIYYTLPYPPVAESAVSSAGAAPTNTAPASAGPASAGPASREPASARIGDIEVTATTLRTPAGEVPLAAATVRVTDEPLVRTPTWAVFCAIVGFFVMPVVSLLFLLARETVPAAAVRVSVDAATADDRRVHHETRAVDPAEVELARSLASR